MQRGDAKDKIRTKDTQTDEERESNNIRKRGDEKYKTRRKDTREKG